MDFTKQIDGLTPYLPQRDEISHPHAIAAWKMGNDEKFQQKILEYFNSNEHRFYSDYYFSIQAFYKDFGMPFGLEEFRDLSKKITPEHIKLVMQNLAFGLDYMEGEFPMDVPSKDIEYINDKRGSHFMGTPKIGQYDGTRIYISPPLLIFATALYVENKKLASREAGLCQVHPLNFSSMIYCDEWYHRYQDRVLKQRFCHTSNIYRELQYLEDPQERDAGLVGEAFIGAKLPYKDVMIDIKGNKVPLREVLYQRMLDPFPINPVERKMIEGYTRFPSLLPSNPRSPFGTFRKIDDFYQRLADGTEKLEGK